MSGYTNGSLSYTDIGSRMQKGAVGYYNRNYYYVLNPDGTIGTQSNYQYIGGNIFAAYPFNRYYRLEGEVGYNDRDFNGYPVWVETDEGRGIIGIPTSNGYATLGTRLVGDTTQYESFGPISGRKLSIGLSWSPYISGTKLPGQDGITLTWDATMDLRHYFKVTRRSLFAIRLYGFRADGNLPDVLAFGGIDTLRTFPVYGIVGNTAGFLNIEFRFPLIDLLTTPFLGIRESAERCSSTSAARSSKPALAVLGLTTRSAATAVDLRRRSARLQRLAGRVLRLGIRFQTNFLGLLHFDVARQWNFNKQLTNFKLFFYLGQEF